MINESFYAYDQSIEDYTADYVSLGLTAPMTYLDLEFMEVATQIYPGFLAPCDLQSNDAKKYIALSPKDHPVIDYLKFSLEDQLKDGLGMEIMLFEDKEEILKYTGNEDYELVDD